MSSAEAVRALAAEINLLVAFAHDPEHPALSFCGGNFPARTLQEYFGPMRDSMGRIPISSINPILCTFRHFLRSFPIELTNALPGYPWSVGEAEDDCAPHAKEKVVAQQEELDEERTEALLRSSMESVEGRPLIPISARKGG